jgi:uncharacterized protein (TIRG00374 family)
MTDRKKNILKLLIGITFSLVAIYVISTHIDFKQLIDKLRSFDIHLLCILVLFYPSSIYLRSVRWRILIEQKVEVPISLLMRAMVLGFFANYILPAKMGEVIRAELVKNKLQTSRSFMLTTVVAERLLDAIVLLFFLIFSALFSRTIQILIHHNIYSTLLFVVALFVLLYVILNRNFLTLLLHFVPKLNGKSDSILINIILALSFYKNRLIFTKVFLLTLGIWLILTLYYLLIAMGLNINLPYYGYFFLISMAAFGMILPASPGNIGVYHGIVMASILLFLPTENEKALSFAIISHAFDMIPAILFGIIVLQHTGLSLKTNSKINEQP